LHLCIAKDAVDLVVKNGRLALVDKAHDDGGRGADRQNRVGHEESRHFEGARLAALLLGRHKRQPWRRIEMLD
jgi:hypothetical protein